MASSSSSSSTGARSGRRRLYLRNKRKGRGSGSASKKPKFNPSGTAELPPFLGATVDSLETMPDWCDYPVQSISKNSEDDYDEDDLCFICKDGSEDIMACCDYCPKVFHLKCHIPVIHTAPTDYDIEKWRCNYDKPKALVLQEIQGMPDDIPDSEEKPLTDANPRQFALACKFMMEVYKIPEIPTMKWVFPEEYLKEFRIVPYHLKFLREKLCLHVEKGLHPFSSVKDYMDAFRQMFSQALKIYQVKGMSDNRQHAVNCLKKFQKLVKEYYPKHEIIFANIRR